MSDDSTALVETRPVNTMMPRVTVQQMIDRHNCVVELYERVMRRDQDYGVIPGTNKPTLFKPGAEKLCTLFGLSVEDPEIVKCVEDWTGKDHDGEPFFYYMIRQRLTHNGVLIASQIASCNSWEKKYRFRNADRLCPKCGKAAILKSNREPPGYFCWSKKDGCGAKFALGDPAIEKQETGKIANPDIADVVNTVLKMAEKRSLIAGVLVATNCSELFTQDLETIADAEYTVVPPQPPRKAAPSKAQEPEASAAYLRLHEAFDRCWVDEDIRKVAESAHKRKGEMTPGEITLLENDYRLAVNRVQGAASRRASVKLLEDLDVLFERLGWNGEEQRAFLHNLYPKATVVQDLTEGETEVLLRSVRKKAEEARAPAEAR